ncbi:MAG: phosphoribosylanthranilate isomerase [Bacteroidales bacterium]|nr:phosphoribosylanthranilate isomerase [Bacteroidales bacterium]
MKDTGLKIKVCGMRDKENIRSLIRLNPDYIGFILYPGSKRFPGDDYTLNVGIPGEIQKVGVFVNALIPEIFSWINRLDLQLVQLHGNESPEYCYELKKMDIRIIKSFGIDNDFDFSILEPYLSCCDYFLFDTKTDLHGGSGMQFDWNILKSYKASIPIFLSGGIGPDDNEILHNYRSIINIFGIDINSRFEIQPGLKNIAALKSFFQKIRSN